VNSAELMAYSEEHLLYELLMFRLAATTIPPRPTSETTLFFSNAHAEAFALHLRNLIVFLYPDRFPKKSDDVAADDFSGDWLSHRPPLPAVLETAKKRADKELAHMTTLRIPGRPPEKHWNIRGLVRPLNDILALFATAADPTRLGPKARGEIAALAALNVR
jgi:hypothetical protein